jgi:hypothetical protein
MYDTTPETGWMDAIAFALFVVFVLLTFLTW